MNETNTDKWFGPLAHLTVVTAIAALTVHMHESVSQATFSWWPYPAFAAMVAVMFMAYGALRRS